MLTEAHKGKNNLHKNFECSVRQYDLLSSRYNSLSGFRRCVGEVSLFWDVILTILIVVYRLFGTDYHSHLQGSKCPKKMEATGCPVTLVNNYQHMARNIPEDQRPLCSSLRRE